VKGKATSSPGDEGCSKLPRYAIRTRSGEDLLGWPMLVVQDPTWVEINPWFQGLVVPDRSRLE